MMRLWIWPLLAVVLALGIWLSLRPSAPPEPGGAPNTVRFAIAGDENNLTPYTITYRSGATQDILNLVYDTLLYSPNEREPQPWLAESASMSADSHEWTFTLRDDVLWHDGQPFTAEDVRFSFEYFARHEQGRYSHHVNDLPDVERVEVIDAHTVRMRCRTPCPSFDIDPAADLPMLPKHVWSSVDEPARYSEALPVGTGPYRLIEHRSGRFYRLAANGDYFLGEPTVDEIHLPVIRNSAAMFQALISGEVDATARMVPPESLAAMQGAGIDVFHAPTYASYQINMNTQRPPFDHPDFRRALALATDSERLVEVLLLGYGDAGRSSVVDPDSPLAHAGLEPEYDPAKAAALLDSLGFTDQNGDGIRQTADARPLHFEVLVPSIESREIRAAEMVAENLASIGVDLRVVAHDPVTVNSRRRPAEEADRVGHTTQTGDYDMYVTSYVGGHFHFDPDGLYYFFLCPGESGFGAYIAGYCNRDFDALVQRAAHLSYDERRPLLWAAQEILYREPPVISLYFPDGLFAYRSAAYSGWVHELGHGIFHKRSFLRLPTSGEPVDAENRQALVEAADDDASFP